MRLCEKCQTVELTKRQRRFCSHVCRNLYLATIHRKSGWKKPGLEATIRPTILDVAWLAGIIEGEGSFSGSSRTLQISVGQKDSWLLGRLVELFGGRVSPQGTQNVCSWRISGSRARGVAWSVYPFLSPRRREQFLNAYYLAA